MFKALFWVFLLYFEVQGLDSKIIRKGGRLRRKYPASCHQLNLKVQPVSPSHLFLRTARPVIISKRGRTDLFQENTKEGVISAICDLGVEAVEYDVAKTKDDKLVLFNDGNTKRMTGVNKVVAESTYEELQKLDIMKEIHFGGKIFNYDQTRKIPLFEDVLLATRQYKVVHFIEMVPYLPFTGDTIEAAKTGQLVAAMVTRLGMVNNVFIMSSDFRKIAAAKAANPQISTVALFGSPGLLFPKAVYVKEFEKAGELSRLTGAPNPFTAIEQCIKDSPDSTEEFFDFVVNHGIIFKAIGVSFLGLDFPVYQRNPKLLRIFRRNYGKKISAGIGTLYDQEKSEDQNKVDEKTLLRLLADRKGTLQRILTDDVPRLRRLLCV
eukprot:TCONS_00049701-protein